ncbi:MAG: peptidase, partial [Blastocatellia bacterium]
MKKFPLLLFLLLFACGSRAIASVTIQIQNVDPAGSGFNDPTAVSPVGGNSGQTLGDQRLIAFQFAANVWGATLNSNVPIVIRAQWDLTGPGTCTPTAGTLGSAGTNGIQMNFANAPFQNTWYSTALANALSGSDQNGSAAEINAHFNPNLGTPGCLTSSPWYMGLDGNHGGGVDLVAVLLHEFSHGLGFQTFTSASSGNFNGGSPSIFDKFLFDNTTNKTWEQMTSSERVASAINTGHLTWNGSHVVADVPNVLGTPRLRINSPGAIAGNYQVGIADFGPSVTSPGVTANVVRALDPADGSGPTTTDGCSAFTNAGAVSGNIAFIDRGTCMFTVKVKNAQNAGAIGVIIGNVASSPNPDTAPELGGTDATITIPAVGIAVTDANSIRAQLGGTVNGAILLDHSVFSGADSANRGLMYAPNPLESGSSVSHFDTSMFPNQLMEPNNSADLTHLVDVPQDLVTDVMRDIGWSTGATGSTIQFSASTYNVNEGAGDLTVTVTRSGDTS